MIIHIKNTLLYTMVLFIVIFFSSISLCQTEAQVSIPFEIYDNAGGQKILYFGLDQTATNGIDFLLGESDLPPYPPTGAFDARWILPENGFNGSLSSWLDYRNAPGFPYSGTVEHRLRYQSMLGATEMYFKWNVPPEVTGLVQDLIDGSFISVPIEGHGSYQIMNFEVFNQLKLFVYYNNVVTDVVDSNPGEYDFKLEQNYPNPFNPSTKIRFVIPDEVRNLKDFSSQTPRNDNSFITLKVYDVLGNEIATLVNEEKPAGIYEIEFNSHSGLSGIMELPSGIYFYQLMVNELIQTKKMIFLK
ncbi:MAG: T9SS type A sorting domain-containing protein [bacterium]|nr:T9SS type A sorting domain-containing protein [bacterium]